MALAINGTTGISGVDGSASAPAVVGSDSNTGISFASDTITLNTGGTSRVNVDSSGHLNIPNDSGKLRLGTSADLELFHNGSDSFLKSATASVNLIIESAHGVDIKHGGENMIRCIGDGNVELYCDNTKRLNTSTSGIEIVGLVYVGQGHAVNVMNRDSNGTLLEFQTTGTARGSISVSGNTVSFNGGHLSRWSQIKGLSSTDKSARPTIYKGTVMSNLDDLCVWKDKEPEQLNMTKISDTEGDKDVAGVFWAWDEDNTVEVNDFYLSMTGDMVIRVAASTTVARGDLLISAGDGTAKPQADDIVRSSTIAKITSTTSTATYADGSKAYPCVLMAC